LDEAQLAAGRLDQAGPDRPDVLLIGSSASTVKHISTYVLLPVYEFVFTNTPVGGQWRSRAFFGDDLLNLGIHFIPLSDVERGCRWSLTRWLADDRPPSAGKPAAIRPRSWDCRTAGERSVF